MSLVSSGMLHPAHIRSPSHSFPVKHLMLPLALPLQIKKFNRVINRRQSNEDVAMLARLRRR